MGGTHVDGDDGFLGLHAPNAVRDGHGPEAVGFTGLHRKVVKHLRQLLLPCVEFQP